MFRKDLNQIILLEDYEEDRILIKRVLRKNNILADIIECEDENSFLNALSDYHLPGFYGTDALSHAKLIYPWVPFVFVSGKISQELIKESVLSDADAYLIKDNLDLLPQIIKIAQQTCENYQFNNNLLEMMKSLRMDIEFQKDFLNLIRKHLSKQETNMNRMKLDIDSIKKRKKQALNI